MGTQVAVGTKNMSRLSVLLGLALVAVAAASPYNYYIDNYNPVGFYGSGYGTSAYNRPEDFYRYGMDSYGEPSGHYFEASPDMVGQFEYGYPWIMNDFDYEGYYPVFYNNMENCADSYNHGRFNPYYGFRYYGY